MSLRRHSENAGEQQTEYIELQESDAVQDLNDDDLYGNASQAVQGESSVPTAGEVLTRLPSEPT